MERTIFSTDGTCLRFTTEASHRRYKLRSWILDMQTYGDHRDMHGIWASNQGKYVRSPDELNDFDGRYMEENYAKYLQMEGIVNGQVR